MRLCRIVKLCKCKQPVSKGSRTRCKDCDAKYKWYYNQKKRFGLEREDLELMFLEQNGCCAICHTPFLTDRPRVDHNHETNEVRGLLCHHCNTALGLFKDSTEALTNAISYLKK